MADERRIRLFIDAHCFDGEYQGSRTFIRGIYTALCRNKDIHFFFGAFDIASLMKIFGEADNISYIKYRSKSGLYRLAIDIPRLIRRYSIDYAHFQYILPLIKNCRQIVTIHDVIFLEDRVSFSYGYRRLKTYLYKRSARMADHITTVSGHSRDSIIRHLAAPPGKITVIPNAVGKHFFMEYDALASKAYIRSKFGFDKFLLCVGRLEPRKNQLLLVQCFIDLDLCTKGYHLVLLGHESIRIVGLSALLASLPPAVRLFIHIDDSVSDNDLPEFYRAADLFIYPSQAEGFGIPPLEAAAARVPVICSNTSAMNDFTFLGDGRVDPRVQGLLRARIQEKTGSERDEQKLRSIAGEVKKRYSWERSADSLYQLIHNHSIIPNDQFSTTRGKEGRMEAGLPAGEAILLSRDR